MFNTPFHFEIGTYKVSSSAVRAANGFKKWVTAMGRGDADMRNVF